MALSETAGIDRIEVLPDGIIQLREANVIARDGEELTRTYRRRVLSPGDDTLRETAQVRAVCAAVWTAEIVAAYRDKLARAPQD
jgi:hypothetical protein